MLNLDFYYIDCEDKDLRDKMFITELKGITWDLLNMNTEKK